MARPPSEHPTDAELEILKVLWDAGPSELGQVVTALNRSRTIAATTVATTLKIMMQKGSVAREQGARGYLWSASAPRAATTSGLLKRLVDRAFDGSAGRLVARLVEDGALTERDREEIRQLLEAPDASKSQTKAKKERKP